MVSIFLKDNGNGIKIIWQLIHRLSDLFTNISIFDFKDQAQADMYKKILVYTGSAKIKTKFLRVLR